MNSTEITDPHLPLLHAIESALADAYERNPGLTDNMAVFGLDAAKVAIKKTQGYAKNQRVSDEPAIQDIIADCVAVAEKSLKPQGDYALHDFLKCMDTVQRSVRRHSSHGIRGYYEFIKGFLGR